MDTGLKNLVDHNREVLEKREATWYERCKSGIACPICGEELMYSDNPFVVVFGTTVPAWCKNQHEHRVELP
jgi:hypothetical protein